MISSVEKERATDAEAYENQRKAFKETLDEALKLVGEFQSENCFYHFGKAGGWKGKLASIHQRLTDHAESYNLSIGVQGLIDREADKAALSGDIEDLRTLMTEILQASNHTKQDLETITDVLLVLKNHYAELLQDHDTVLTNLTKLEELATNLSKSISTAETEIVIVDEGATVSKLVNRYVSQEFNFKAPSGTSGDELDRLQQFAAQLRGAVPESKIKMTVVKKGGKVDDLLQETKDFLLHFELTHQPTTERSATSSQKSENKLNSNASLFSSNKASEEQQFPVDATKTSTAESSFSPK